MSQTPKPKNISALNITMLRTYLPTMDEARFTQFKLCVRDNAKVYLNTSRAKKMQDPARWKVFRNKIISEFPEIKEYAEGWPIEAYFNKSLHRRPARAASTATANTRPSSSLRNSSSNLQVRSGRLTPSGIRKRVFVGKTPPPYVSRTIHLATPPRNAAPTPSRSTTTVIHLNNTQQAFSAQHQRITQSLSQNSLSELSNNVGGRSIQVYAQRYGNTSANSPIYPVPCLYCGNSPTVAPVFNRNISTLLHGRESLISALASIGIVSDYHLDLFVRHGIDGFLRSLSSEIISPLHKTIIMAHLGKDRRRDAEGLQVISGALSIQQPSSDAEKRITMSSTNDLLRKAMGLENHFIYFLDLVETIETKLKELWPNSQDEDENEGVCLVNEICAEYPELGNYENYWPIRFYLKWRRQRTWNRENQENIPIYSMTPTAQGSSLLSEEFLAPKPVFGTSAVRMPRSTCLIHPLPDSTKVSPKLLVHLRNFGMEELLPAFLAVGIKSNDDYELFCGLEKDNQHSMFEDTTMSIKPFQMMMLEVVVNAAKK